MSKKILIYSGGTVIVTVFLMLSYLSFNVLGITQSRVKRYELTIVTEGAEKVYDGNQHARCNCNNCHQNHNNEHWHLI